MQNQLKLSSDISLFLDNYVKWFTSQVKIESYAMYVLKEDLIYLKTHKNFPLAIAQDFEKIAFEKTFSEIRRTLEVFLNQRHLRFEIDFIYSKNQKSKALFISQVENVHDKTSYSNYYEYIKSLIDILEDEKFSSPLWEQFNQIQMITATGTWELNLSNGKTVWSDQVYRIYKLDLGLPTNKIDGISFYAEHERPRLIDLLDKVQKEKIQMEGVFEFYDSGKNKKWVKVVAKPFLQNNHLTKIVGIFQDVTEETHFKYLVQSEKTKAEVLASRLGIALEGAHLGIWDWNLKDNSVKYDHRWAEIRGLKLTDLKGSFEDFSTTIHPDDLPRLQKAVEAYLAKKVPAYQCQFRVRHNDGSFRHVFAQGKISQHDELGNPILFSGTDLDVTEVKYAQNNFEQLFLKASFGLVLADKNLKIVQANNWFEDFVESSSVQVKQIDFKSYFNHDNQKKLNDYIESVDLQYEKDTLCLSFQKRDKSIAYIELVAFKISEITGEDAFWLILKDISPQVRVSNENAALLKNLENSNQRLNNYFDQSLVYMCILNSNAILLRQNNMFRNFGLESQVESKKSFYDFIESETRHQVKELIDQNYLLDRPHVLLVNMINSKGEKRLINWNATHDKPAELILMVGVDVTLEKENERILFNLANMRSKFIEVGENKSKFFEYVLQLLIESSESEYGFIGQVLEDEKGRFLKTFALTDISWNEETANFYKRHAPQGLEFRNLQTLFGEVIKTERPIIANQAPQHPKAGGIPQGHPPLRKFLGIPINYQNKMIGMVGLANGKRDYSENHLAYLKPYLDAMGEMVYIFVAQEEINKQKNLALHNSRLASIGKLAAGVGHEINNPLAIILGHLEMLKSEITDKNQTPLKRIEKMESALLRISHIVKGLRTFARSDDLEFSAFDVRQLIKETVEMMIEIFEKDNCHLRWDTPATAEYYIKGNRARLQQVLVNLITNAKDATLQKVQRLITVKLNQDNSNIWFIVSDNGTGIPLEIRDKIFDPFFTTKDVNKGTGIGLALVNSIVKEHKGEIELESHIGEGTSFKIILPRHKDSLPLEAPKSHSSSTIEDSRPASVKKVSQDKFPFHVLIVDDEPDLREILEVILSKVCHKVSMAASASEALTQLRSQKIDVVVSDIKMPEVDGIQLFLMVQREFANRFSYIFISGGVDMSLDHLKVIEDNKIPLLSKPFKEKDIKQLLSQIYLRREK